MALVCTSCYVGHVRIKENDSKVAGVCSGVPSRCHVIVFQSPDTDSQAVSCLNLVWPKTMRGWEHAGSVCALKRNRGGPQRCRQWRVFFSNLHNSSAGSSDAKTGNGGTRTVALTHPDKVDSNLDDDIEGKFAASIADSPHTIPRSGRSDNGQEKKVVVKSFLEAEEKCVSLVWEAGSEIEKLTPEMAAMNDKNDTEDQEFSSTVEEVQRRQEEPLPGVKISQHVSRSGAQWLNWRTVIEGPVYVSSEYNAFYEFIGNLSKIQRKFWLTVIIHVKLAWIKLQQLLAMRLRALEGILANFPESENDLNVREKELLVFSNKLLHQSALHEEAYRRSQEALRRAEGMVFQLNTQVGQLMEDVASREALLRLLQKETSVSSESLQRAAQSLSDAERRLINLEKQGQIGENSLGEEREKVAAAMKSAGSLEEAARVAENLVAELTAEVSSLKVLAVAGRRAEHLTAQVHALEKELRSRDSLLLEIKTETRRSTEALSVAAQIKQDLNATRQREVQLAQALEGANSRVKELQIELVENLRGVRAEQALRQMEKMLRDASMEVQTLRKGVEERDKAIYVMKDEVDLSINLLNSAARNREELKKIKLQMEDLRADLGSKDNKLKILREEMASVIDLARHNENTSLGTSISDLATLPAVKAKPSVQVLKQRKKPQSRKRTSSPRSSESSPE